MQPLMLIMYTSGSANFLTLHMLISRGWMVNAFQPRVKPSIHWMTTMDRPGRSLFSLLTTSATM
jgi:hypothetical protein